ncbi:MAG TPA: diguanylate cyclase [Gemmatimonadales bacterium]|jgi:diguanylate cyclase (GGDEF)-like protein
MRLSTLEQSVSKNARILRLDSIRSRILFFAVVATLIPSLSTAWLSYTQNKRSLNNKITEQLESTSRQSSRELELWLKDRLAELRVFAISDAVTLNLDQVPRGGGGPAVRRMNDYLKSVRERFADYLELMVVDPQGRVIATSARSSRPVQLPTDWTSDIAAGRTALGEPYRDEDLGATLLVATVPIAVPSRRFLGALTAKLSLVDLERTLRDFSLADSGRVYLVTTDGALVTSAAGPGARLTTAAMQRLSEQDGHVTRYRNHTGDLVLGSLRRGSEQRLAVVAEITATAAFREVTRMRNLTLLLVSTLLVGIGLIAYLLGLFIVRPLARLTKGAAKVAAGDLDVDLPVLSGGEVGYLTEVFNNMVVRLREGHQALDAANETLRRKNEELETLSVTDGLTGLHNRRRLMESLADEVRRSQRLKHTFSVLMVDVDHFKKYNDTFGHLAGDGVLARVAALLREATREVDDVARYGGEEFLVMLPETGMTEALEIAERVRARVAAEVFPGRRITVSIGVSEFPLYGNTPEQVIAAADEALYEAKREGRDRVRRAGLKLVREPKPKKERAG